MGGGGVVGLGANFDGVAAEVIGLGEGGGVVAADDGVGVADGVVGLSGVEGLFAGIQFLAGLGVAGAGGEEKRQSQNRRMDIRIGHLDFRLLVCALGFSFASLPPGDIVFPC